LSMWMEDKDESSWMEELGFHVDGVEDELGRLRRRFLVDGRQERVRRPRRKGLVSQRSKKPITSLGEEWINAGPERARRRLLEQRDKLREEQGSRGLNEEDSTMLHEIEQLLTAWGVVPGSI
jgi:hypothetical protein